MGWKGKFIGGFFGGGIGATIGDAIQDAQQEKRKTIQKRTLNTTDKVILNEPPKTSIPKKKESFVSFLKSLNSSDIDTRRNAALSFGKINDLEAQNVLDEMLNDSDEFVEVLEKISERFYMKTMNSYGFRDEVLYTTKKGNWFLYCNYESGSSGHAIVPLSADSAYKWLIGERSDLAEKYFPDTIEEA